MALPKPLNEIQKSAPQVPLAEVPQWTAEQMKLIVDVVAKNATPDELKLFLYRCNKMGLDPLKAGQIFFIKYNRDSPGTIVIGIEGFRSRAAKTGKHIGTERGVLKDDKGKCTGAWAKVYREGWKIPASTEVSLAEYDTGFGNWKTKPETMILKVGEAAALRIAFPDELGDVYTPEEMEKTAIDSKQTTIYADQPGEGDGVHRSDAEYRIPFGQWARKSIDEILRDPSIGPKRVEKYIELLEKPAQIAKRKPHNVPLVADFIERASDAIAFAEMDQTRGDGE